MEKKEKIILAALFVAFISVFILISSIRPYEDDESNHITAGIAIIKGELNPFVLVFYGHFSNPFGYTMGSPLAPIIYGAAYMSGGMSLARLAAMTFVLFSILIVFLIIRRHGGSWIIPVILIGFSSSTILLASDALLDSLALLFLVSAFYLIDRGRMLGAGILTVLAATAKFILVPAVFLFMVYLAYKKKWMFLAGACIVAIPFIFLYSQLIPVLTNFIFLSKLSGIQTNSANYFMIIFLEYLPITTICAFALLVLKRKSIKNGYLFIPIVTVLLYQIATLDATSLPRHLPYAEFAAAIILGSNIGSMGSRNKILVSILLAIFVVAGVTAALLSASYYPSYNSIEGSLGQVNGKVLALNPHAFILIKGMPINATAYNVFSYYFFNYDYMNDTIPDSSIDEYREAINDGFFDYALIFSTSPDGLPVYKAIENIVREKYCPFLISSRTNGIDIYQKCGVNT